jgi:hypothetical protein
MRTSIGMKSRLDLRKNWYNVGKSTNISAEVHSNSSERTKEVERCEVPLWELEASSEVSKP